MQFCCILVEYEKRHSTHCAPSDFGSYSSLSLAKSACNSNVRCKGVYDNLCDNYNSFSLCPLSSDFEIGETHSCVYEKLCLPGKQEIIKIYFYRYFWSAWYPTLWFLISFFKTLVNCDPSCINGGTCDETAGTCVCPPECSGDHCQTCKGMHFICYWYLFFFRRYFWF